ncbi:MAG TPA: CBS domain-containing protein, partial [Actinomycetota bacterium]|nr:CBS domain-containing protein [Actinomycetota bacterium]
HDLTSFVGSIRERSLLDRVFRDPDAMQADVAQVMGPPFPAVGEHEPVEVAFEQLQSGPAVIVARGSEAIGVVTRSDLLEFLAERDR